MIDLETLKTYSLFGGMSTDALRSIAGYLEEKTFKAGSSIVTQGERSESVYLIIKGKASVIVDEAELTVLHEGESFGEMHLIDIMPRSATIKTLTEVTTLSLCNKDIISLKEENMYTYLMIIMNCARNISRRLRNTNKAYARLLQECQKVD